MSGQASLGKAHSKSVIYRLRNSVNSKIRFYSLADRINVNFYYRPDEPDKTVKNANIRYEVTDTSGDIAGLHMDRQSIVYFVKRAGSNEEEVVATFLPS